MKYQLLELRSSLLNDELFNMLQEIPKTDEFGQTNEYYGKTRKEIVEEINSREKRDSRDFEVLVGSWRRSSLCVSV